MSPSFKDQRMNFINHSNLRNDLQIFEFNQESSSFGKGGAQIQDVCLLDENETPLSWIVGGEKVILRIVAKTHEYLDEPIIGFFIKDRTGQCLFGDNTFQSHRKCAIKCPEDSELIADFMFDMPILPTGNYSVSVAIANGTQDDHEQHHWINDAVIFKSESSSVASGVIGIPMHDIKLYSLTAAS